VADLREVRRVSLSGAVEEWEATRGGQQLTGRVAAEFTKRSAKGLLQKFGEDEFVGKVPDWRCSLSAMRHLGFELPEAETLSVSGGGAIAWAMGTQSVRIVSTHLDTLEVTKIVEEGGEE
jgi:hypothetical protein